MRCGRSAILLRWCVRHVCRVFRDSALGGQLIVICYDQDDEKERIVPEEKSDPAEESAEPHPDRKPLLKDYVLQACSQKREYESEMASAQYRKALELFFPKKQDEGDWECLKPWKAPCKDWIAVVELAKMFGSDEGCSWEEEDGASLNAEAKWFSHPWHKKVHHEIPLKKFSNNPKFFSEKEGDEVHD